MQLSRGMAMNVKVDVERKTNVPKELRHVSKLSIRVSARYE